KSLAPGLYLPLGLIFLAAIGVTLFLYYKQSKKGNLDTTLPEGKPLNMQSAIVFGIVYSLIILLVSYTNEYFGSSGIFISSAIAGLTDIDAITISVSKLAGESLTIPVAHNAILLATISNTIIKIGIALWTGSKALRKYIYIGYGCILLAAIISLVILNV